MKSLPIALDRMLANPTYERVEGKLLKVSDDKMRIILELKGKKLRTLLGPFAETDWELLGNKLVVAFAKAGEATRVFDAKKLPREERAAAAGAKKAVTKRAAPKTERVHAPKVKWTKFAEGRMVGEPVKIGHIERGFDLDADLVLRTLQHLEITPGEVTNVISYADFRKFFHFICEPGFKDFQNQ